MNIDNCSLGLCSVVLLNSKSYCIEQLFNEYTRIVPRRLMLVHSQFKKITKCILIVSKTIFTNN